MRMRLYWEERYRRQGRRTVGYAGHDAATFSQVTEKIRATVRAEVNPLIRGRNVLDFGCGFGRLVPVLMESAAAVHGLDISRWAIKEARAYAPGGFYARYDGQRLPYRDGTFGAVFCWTVLQHIPDDELPGLAREIERVLSVNGRLILYENSSTWLQDKEHIWFREPGDYAGVFGACGIVSGKAMPDTDGSGESHYLLILEKGQERIRC